LFFALVDAMPMREAAVGARLEARRDLRGVARVKERSYDFLIAFEQPSFSTVDDFLRTHIQSLPDVLGVEIIQDWADYGDALRAARDKMRV
jgi:hypothetical protein